MLVKTETAIQHQINQADDLMVSAIENHIMQLPEFSHQVHVKLAYCYLASDGFKKGGIRMQNTLKNFLKNLGVSPDKFHMTITHAWLIAIWHFMQNTPVVNSADEFLAHNPVLLNKDILLAHYSHDRLFSDRARKKFIEPDLTPFPN